MHLSTFLFHFPTAHFIQCHYSHNTSFTLRFELTCRAISLASSKSSPSFLLLSRVPIFNSAKNNASSVHRTNQHVPEVKSRGSYWRSTCITRRLAHIISGRVDAHRRIGVDIHAGNTVMNTRALGVQVFPGGLQIRSGVAPKRNLRSTYGTALRAGSNGQDIHIRRSLKSKATGFCKYASRLAKLCSRFEQRRRVCSFLNWIWIWH